MKEYDGNKALAARWLELVSAGSVDELCEITASDWRMHGGPPSLPSGPDGIRALFRTFGSIEQTWTIHDVIAEGTKVVIRATNSCVQDSFLGLPGRGRRQNFTATFIFRVVDGQVCEIWRNADDLGRLLQLGGHIRSE
jgi:SnoaL-like domain